MADLIISRSEQRVFSEMQHEHTEKPDMWFQENLFTAAYATGTIPLKSHGKI